MACEGGDTIHLTLALCILTELEKVPGDEKTNLRSPFQKPGWLPYMLA